MKESAIFARSDDGDGFGWGIVGRGGLAVLAAKLSGALDRPFIVLPDQDDPIRRKMFLIAALIGSIILAITENVDVQCPCRLPK